MKILKVCELTVEQAKYYLAEFFASFLINDRDNTQMLIKNGELASYVPNIPTLTSEEVVTRFAELDIGRNIAKNHKASQVVIAVEERWEIVFDIDSIPTDERWTIDMRWIWNNGLSSS